MATCPVHDTDNYSILNSQNDSDTEGSDNSPQLTPAPTTPALATWAMPPSFGRQRTSSSNDVFPSNSNGSSSSSSNTSLAAAAAGVGIPQFRSSRTVYQHHQHNVHMHIPKLERSGGSGIRRRRSVSDNSSCSTSSSTSSFGQFPYSSHAIAMDTDDEGDSQNDDDDDDAENAAARANSLHRTTVPPLPQPPYPVDPYHFYCKHEHQNATALAMEITALLKDCDIEFRYTPLKCKFKCIKYVHYSHLEFIVRVYTHVNSFLIEFQRRSGSILLWDGLYNTLYHRLASGDWIDAQAAACTQSGSQKKVGLVATSANGSLSTQVWKTLTMASVTPSSGVEAMKLMLTSKYVDAQREGCSGLAVLTEDPQSAFLVAKYNLVEPLVVAAESDDLTMARCAVGALANISNAMASFPSKEIAQKTLEQIKRAAEIVIELLAKTTDTLFALELLRECTRALGSFGKICPQHVVEYEGNTQLLHHVKHRDRQVAAHCREALQWLQMNV